MSAVLGRLCAFFVRPADARAAAGGEADARRDLAWAAPVAAQGAALPVGPGTPGEGGGWAAPVADVGTAPRAVSAAATAPAAVALLCAPDAAGSGGAVTGLAAARRRRAACAVVCTWTGEEHARGGPERGGLAVAKARRLATRIRRRGIDADARGRLVRVALPPEPGAAVALVAQVGAAAGETPVITVIAGTRPEAFDALLARQDRVVVVPPRGDLEDVGRLAVLEAARVARAVGVLELPAIGVTRLALRAGIGLAPRTRRAASAALDGHGA